MEFTVTGAFEITAEWLAGDYGPREYRETYAEIGIRINSACATEVEDIRARSVRCTIRVPAYPLALWLTANWWRLRWESELNHLDKHTGLDWRMSHDLAACGDGYVWPALVFSSDGFRIKAACRPTRYSGPDTVASIRYLNAFEEFLTPNHFEYGVARFVDQVTSRLVGRGIQHSQLQIMWSEVSTERTKTSLIAERKLEALLGMDADQDSELIANLLRWRKRIGENALDELAAASSPTEIQGLLNETSEAEKGVRSTGKIDDLDRLRASVSDQDPALSGTPSTTGRNFASLLRKEWQLGKQPIPNERFAEILNLDQKTLLDSSSGVTWSTVVRDEAEERIKFLFKSGQSYRYENRRFELSRLIGDYVVLNSQDRWKPATGSFTARQKFQRAFAAEFLCPSDVLVERRENRALNIDEIDEFIQQTANEYQVSTMVVFNHLHNRRLLPHGTAA